MELLLLTLKLSHYNILISTIKKTKMNRVELFDKALKYHKRTKKEFTQKSAIPYDTVAG